MHDKTLSARLALYAPANAIEQENVLQEILRDSI